MEVLLYSFSIVLLMFVQGTAVIKLFKLQDCSLVANNPLFSVLMGVVLDIAVLETVGLILPISIVTIIIVLFSACALTWCAKDLLKAFPCWRKNSLWSVMVLFVPILIVGLPQIVEGELYANLLNNNDFGYYFASIDWLKGHSILEPILYSHSMPYASQAEFMLESTRIGLDLLGAFCACLFNIEPHQVYALLAVLVSVSLSISIYSVIVRFAGNHVCGMLFGIYAALCGNNISLLIQQYLPQVLGVSFLIAAFACIYDLIFHRGSREEILCGWMVSAVFATYCEYAIYIVAYALVVLVCGLIASKVDVVRILKAVMICVLLNVYGFLKAVKFNLWIFTRVSGGGMGEIDPYGGVVMNRWNVLGSVLGMSTKDWAASLGDAYKIVSIIGICAIIFVLFFWVRKKNAPAKVFVFATLGVLAVLELYFRGTGGAYQEYKHMTTVSSMVIGVIGVVCSLLWNVAKIRLNRIVVAVSLMAVASTSVYTPFCFYMNSCIKVNSEFMQLAQAVAQIPEYEEVAIDSEMPVTEYMLATYVLRDRYVNLGKTSLSYLHYFQAFDDDSSRYTVVYNNKLNMNFDSDKNILWGNDLFLLVEDTTIPREIRLSLSSSRYHGAAITVCKNCDTLANLDGTEGFLAYGPYVDIDSGTYDITVEYTVMESNGNGGFADIYSQGNTLAYAELETSVGYHELVFEDMSFDQAKAVEFRVYARQGSVIKLEGITYRESNNG